LIEIEGDGCCDVDSRENGVGVLIVSCGDTPPVLEFGGQVLGFMTMAIEALVAVERRFAAFGRRNA